MSTLDISGAEVTADVLLRIPGSIYQFIYFFKCVTINSMNSSVPRRPTEHGRRLSSGEATTSALHLSYSPATKKRKQRSSAGNAWHYVCFKINTKCHYYTVLNSKDEQFLSLNHMYVVTKRSPGSIKVLDPLPRIAPPRRSPSRMIGC